MNALTELQTYSDGDVDTNDTGNETLWSLVERRYSRRDTMSGIAAAGAAFMGAGLLSACEHDGTGGQTALSVTAGSDGATSAGRQVTLSGGVTAGPLQPIGWEQVSGPAVSLVNAGSNTASFTAPAVNAATPLTFRFTARSLDGRLVTDETVITVSPAQLGFTAVAKNRQDLVTIPEGYTVTVLYRTGDPLAANVPAYRNDGTDTNFAQRAGDHHDGMYYYGLNAAGTARDDNNSDRGLLAMNHENINEQYLHPTGVTMVNGRRPEGEAIKEIEAHGVSVVEVARTASNAWSYNQASSRNFRVTPNTPVEFRGPVRGHPLLRTAFSPDGTRGRGTINNCAMGSFLWGTYLTCEENWAFYFRRLSTDNVTRSVREQISLRRYGVTSATGNFNWSTVQPADPNNTVFRRWDATADPTRPADGTGDFRNEPYQFGWCVEIDPYDKTKAPRKRTALGRMGHEGAWPGRWVAGRRVTVYLGDDARNEYFYKFVSSTPWNPADAQAADRLAIGDKYLDAGILYVARFNQDGTGAWLPLVFGQVPDRPATGTDPAYVFADQADILMNARLAGDALGATRMDRPEWTATNNQTGEVYLTLTNTNSRARPITATDAANPRHYNDPKRNPGFADNDPNATFRSQVGNPNGHIIRLRESGDNNEALTFRWDIYLFGAGADLDRQNINISGLTAENDFSSPDGLWFSRPQNPAGQSSRQLLWIQTDDGAYTDVTHNQMLAALPGNVGDGGARTITNSAGPNGSTRQQTTFAGAEATPATLRRFTIGPIECEITGVDTTPDGRALFYNIQHPGERGTASAPTSRWPSSQGSGPGPRPRSATVVVTKNDGGIIGL